MTKRLLSATAIFAVLATPGFSQSGTPAGTVDRSLDNMPREEAAEMANDQAGEEIFLTEDGTTDEGGAKPEPVEDVSQDREMSEEGDPITQDRIRLLDETGVIGRQSRISEGILLMNQQVRRADAIANVLSTLGPDAKVEVAPGKFVTFEGTPAAIQAEIDLISLQMDLLEARAELQSGGEGGAEEPRENVEQRPMAARDDGSEFMRLPDQKREGGDSPAPRSEDEEALEAARERARLAEERADEAERRMREAQEEKQRESSDETASGGAERERVRISLREVYGFNGDYTAVVDINGSRRDVSADDRLPGGGRVLDVGPDFILVDLDGEERRFDL